MKERLLEILKKEAYFKQNVILSSGKPSSFYIDVRRVSLTPKGLYLISNLVWELIKDENITAIGGPTLGADPIVAGVCMLAYQNNKDIKGFIVRKEPKKHGRMKLVEGRELSNIDRVVIVDDVATTGSSLLDTLKVLRKENIEVIKAIVVVEREDTARENLLKENCPLVSIFKYTDF